jgi:predicted nucleic acid-binding protein
LPSSLTSFLLDTSPLSVLCSFPLSGTLYIHTILKHADLVLPDGVADEIQVATRGKVARTMLPLIAAGDVMTITAPDAPAILDAAYGNDLGLGERSAIKAALATGMPLVLDDMRAFIAACRFGLQPIVFQDFIVRLAREHDLPKEAAVEIITTTARQFPAMFLKHTLDMLS